MKTPTLSLSETPKQNKFNSPYQLNLSANGSDAFYLMLDIFTDHILKEGHTQFDQLIHQYRCSAAFMNNGFKQSSDENVLDILIMGVLWNQYKGKWGGSIAMKKAILNKLYTIRKNNAFLKPMADNLRGKLTPMLDHPVDENIEMNADNLKHLTMWLSATGEFNEELLRIESWIEFLAGIPKSMEQFFLVHVERFALWFEEEAHAAMKNYTRGVRQFLSTHLLKYRGKEDYFFTGRNEVEYHLNMVGASIMNRSMQKEFLETEHQILLLPSCMKKNENCMSVEVMQGRICTNCTEGCNISKVSQQMKEEGVHTFIIQHSSSFSKYLERWANQNKIGLIGTACTLNLLMGGFEMKRLNIPAQCVFLDYCGCKNHWSEKGLATNINVRQVHNLVKPVKIHHDIAS